MKCLILAGGSGDSLWPLSRKNYPKQFMDIHQNRSSLQETVVRNLPFCDEFLISTSLSYHFIVDGQMKAFQGLIYRCFLEARPAGTAAAVALVCMLSNPTELILAVSADILAGDKHYQEAVLKAKEAAKQGNIVVFAAPARQDTSAVSYMTCSGEEVTGFFVRPDRETAKRLMEENALFHTGMTLFCAGDMLRALQTQQPGLYAACEEIVRNTKRGLDTIQFSAPLMETLPQLSLEEAVLQHLHGLKAVNAAFSWKSIDRFDDIVFENHPLILRNCENVSIVNAADRHLVVADGVKDLTIVHTQDVTLIGKPQETDRIRTLAADYGAKYPSYFNDHKVLYYPYGTQEVLVEDSGYVVKKSVIYPGHTIAEHRHTGRREHWVITEGEALLTVDGTSFSRKAGESADIGDGIFHKIENTAEVPVTIIRTITGKIEKDRKELSSRQSTSGHMQFPNIVKLSPAFQDYIWGGSRIRTELQKKTDLERVAESWELSAHEDGQSVIAEGRYKGMRFGKYLERIGRESWGWKAAQMPRFPLLIKFLDAAAPLSLQVHPDDEYALSNEGEYGKYEMWYILEAKEGAKIYRGFSRPAGKEEIRERIRNGSILEILNEVPVKSGDTVWIEPGCVHALGDGVLLCEIQQNSNSTYRLYDYGRPDSFLHKRPLHIEKALDVIGCAGGNFETSADRECKSYDGYQVQKLGSCKYFVSSLYETWDQAVIDVDEASFVSVLFIEGEGTISDGTTKLTFQKGSSFFLKAGKYSVAIQGKSKCLVTHV